MGAIFEGIGVSVGSFIAGVLFDSIGGGHTFEIFGVAAFIAFIVHVCLQMYLQRHHSSTDNDNGKHSSSPAGDGIVESGEIANLNTKVESIEFVTNCKGATETPSVTNADDNDGDDFRTVDLNS